jgi:hypothetical protein
MNEVITGGNLQPKFSSGRISIEEVPSRPFGTPLEWTGKDPILIFTKGSDRQAALDAGKPRGGLTVRQARLTAAGFSRI